LTISTWREMNQRGSAPIRVWRSMSDAAVLPGRVGGREGAAAAGLVLVPDVHAMPGGEGAAEDGHLREALRTRAVRRLEDGVQRRQRPLQRVGRRLCPRRLPRQLPDRLEQPGMAQVVERARRLAVR